MAMTRLRWGLGGVLVLVSLAAAARALAAYLTHGLWMGSASVLLLGVIALVGFASLAQARRRMDRELRGLDAQPPSGELVERRQAWLSRLKAEGVRVDREALAAATEAEERGRAYLGRYFVAVTVLVGLVGTFAGLMETLRAMGPLLQSDQVSTLQLLAAPLGGLDVTFGASIVGILVTLALALVQGDLVLAEELAITRLEERTVHVLVPALWPAADSPDERAARELTSLRADLQTLVARAGENAATQVSRVAQTALTGLVTEVTARFAQLEQSLAEVAGAVTRELAQAGQVTAQAAQATTQALTEATGTLTRELAALSREHSQLVATSARTASEATGALSRELAQTHAATAAVLRESVGEATGTLTRELAALSREHSQLVATSARTASEGVTQAVQATAQAAQATTQALTEATGTFTRELAQTHAATAAVLRESVGEATGTLTRELAALSREHSQLVATSARTASEAAGALSRELAQTHAATAAVLRESVGEATGTLTRELAQTHSSTAAVLRESLGEAGTRLDGSARELALAASELRGASETLAPSLDKLAPELRALTAELALLVARADAVEDPLVADEIVRLGQGMERLEALLKLAHEGRA